MTATNRLLEERRARLSAERLLEQKQAELFAANKKLGTHAQKLSEEIVEIRDENTRVRSDLERATLKAGIAERRLWDSIETIHDGFAVFDNDGKLIAANRSYIAVFDGLEEVTVGVSYVRILQLLTEEGIVDTGDLSITDWRAMMTQRWQADVIEPITLRLWNDTYIKLMDRRGGEGDMVSLALDITDTIRYEKELRAAHAEAEAATRAKSAFLANMSHEIRTPMNGVVGMAELMQDSELTEEQRLYVDTIKSSGEALLVIINDVLDYSKIEAEKLTLNTTDFDLERCLHEVVMLLQPIARDKGIELLIDYDMFLPAGFHGDPGRIRQVLTNIIGNAVKFTTEGHVLIRVTGHPEGEDPLDMKVHIAIEDTGIGIPENMIGHVFGQFNQVEDEKNRKFEGTGLGLAISKQLVELMDGEIWVESEVDVGSCFGMYIRMPALAGQEAEPLNLPAGLSDVLLVKDDQVTRTIVSKQLSALGVEPDICADSESALALAEETEYDLLIVDLGAATRDGETLVADMRRAGMTVPAIVMSSAPNAAAKNEETVLHLQSTAMRQDLVGLIHDLCPAKEVPLRKMRVLAADDNRTNRLVLEKMLKGLDIELEFATDGNEAVASYQAFAPDLIFMDISMPHKDGKEATRDIRAIETGDPIPICAVTAHAMEGEADPLREAGLDHYLTKPVRKKALYELIEGVMPEGVLPVFPDAQDG